LHRGGSQEGQRDRGTEWREHKMILGGMILFVIIGQKLSRAFQKYYGRGGSKGGFCKGKGSAFVSRTKTLGECI
jgi:hypothetical protein